MGQETRGGSQTAEQQAQFLCKQLFEKGLLGPEETRRGGHRGPDFFRRVWTP